MTAAHGYSQQKENYAKRLRRIEGQIRGIAKMIDEDKYCIDVLTQISAVNSAPQSGARLTAAARTFLTVRKIGENSSGKERSAQKKLRRSQDFARRRWPFGQLQ